jgi:Ca2+-transporting ATPase
MASPPKTRTRPPSNGSIEALSAVEGRARLRVTTLSRAPTLARRIEDRLATHAAVRTVRASAITGTVVVVYDPRRLTLRQVVTELAHSCNGMRAPARRVGAARRRSRGDDPPWHALPAGRVARRLGTSAETGLSSQAAAARLATTGPNRLPVPEPRSSWSILADQLTSLPVLLLGAGATASLIGGLAVDALVILGVVAINATVGFVTERRVDRLLASLHGGGVPPAVVRRDGKLMPVPAAALVPGDVMVLRAGCPVSADGRVLQGDALAANESALTGESLAVPKRAAVVLPQRSPLPERANMVYAGTTISEGGGLAVVTETGRRTELGRVRALIAETVSPPTPLERQLDGLGRRLVGISLGLCGVTLGLGLLRGIPLLEMLRATIALAVAAVPEGLPAVATTTLALGMQRMQRRRALVRRLAAVESLGATTVICVDKTGTITENRMTVRCWHLGATDLVPAAAEGRPRLPDGPLDPRLERALAVAVLCNEADLTRRDGRGWQVNGSGTEGALLDAALRAGLDYRALRRAHPLVRLRPRLDHAHWMATVHDAGSGRRIAMVKGAPEQVLAHSATFFDGAGTPPLLPDDRRAVLEANAAMANQGMRVLGLGFKDAVDPEDGGYDRLTWVGLVGLADPVREGVRETIAACRRAGIRPVMITGDQSLTALAVAREAGLVADGAQSVLDATQLDGLDDAELGRRARTTTVFARVSPAHKYRIVRALQEAGEVVAMTGDGINDGPALRAADIGVAMGAQGTDLARELADVVLLDDDFGSIVAAVEQGRTIHGNIRKALRFLLSTNFSEIVMTLGALALGGIRPLSAIQFLWINLLSDVWPALALAVEPPEHDVLARPPRDPAAPILDARTLLGVAADGVLIAGSALAAAGAAGAWSGNALRASTVGFTTLTSAQLLHALTCRAERGSGLAGLHRSPALLAAVAGSLALQVAGVTVPWLRRLLGTAPLTAADWGVVGAGAVLPLAWGQALQFRPRRSP